MEKITLTELEKESKPRYKVEQYKMDGVIRYCTEFDSAASCKRYILGLPDDVYYNLYKLK